MIFFWIRDFLPRSSTTVLLRLQFCSGWRASESLNVAGRRGRCSRAGKCRAGASLAKRHPGYWRKKSSSRPDGGLIIRFRQSKSVLDIMHPHSVLCGVRQCSPVLIFRYSLVRGAPEKQHLLHRLRYSLFVIRRKDDLQFFSPV